jgi:hypothetical protein
MGVCCFRSIDSGEEYLRKCISIMKIRETSYNKILKILQSKAKNNMIPYKTAQGLLDPYFERQQDDEETVDPNKKHQISYKESFENTIHSKIISKIFDKFQKNSNINIYILSLYLYPLVKHDNDDMVLIDKFYDIFFYGNDKLVQYKSVVFMFKQYLEFCTIELNEIVYNSMEEIKDKEKLYNLMNTVYTKENLEKKLKTFLFGLKETEKDEIIVSSPEFINHFQKYDISNYCDIRDSFLSEYEMK